MQNKRQRASFLKQLYQRKFYEENTAKGMLERVLNFQKKIQDFKISHTHNIQQQPETPTFLLQSENNHFRPITHSSCSRPKKFKYSTHNASIPNEGPAKTELKLLLRNRKQGQLNLLTENMRERNLYSMHEHRKRIRMLSHNRKSSQNESNDSKSKITPIDMSHFYQEKNQIKSEKKVRQVISQKQSPREGLASEQTSRKKSLSRKVMIGGRDLQKAAEEYYQNYKQANKNLKLHEQLMTKLEVNQERPRHTSSEKKRIKITVSRASSRKDGPIKKREINLEREHNYQDMCNQQLNPWHVEADTTFS